ncbi:MAG: PLDc_N domain-containing protein [Eubacterium sp.]|nr:PLDc_N domain-containing protein [Eubacterium sp.]
MGDLQEWLPFLIPLVIVQLVLMGIALRHVLTHERYKTGNRTLWIVIVLLMGYIGPILYFTLGKTDEE